MKGSIILNLLAENLITVSLNRKGKNILKKFECSKCGQMYVYIVKEGTQEVNCDICSTRMMTKGD